MSPVRSCFLRPQCVDDKKRTAFGQVTQLASRNSVGPPNTPQKTFSAHSKGGALLVQRCTNATSDFHMNGHTMIYSYHRKSRVCRRCWIIPDRFANRIIDISWAVCQRWDVYSEASISYQLKDRIGCKALLTCYGNCNLRGRRRVDQVEASEVQTMFYSGSA